MRLVFWLSVALIAYVYAGYPLLLWAAGRVVRARRVANLPPCDLSTLPGISIVIAARNEARRLPARIDNLLAADYPAGLRQILVVSDGSSDDTREVLAPYAREVELVSVPDGGKALALNAADARQRFAPDALRALVAPLADPRIGAVSGELLFEPGGRGSSGEGVGLYWRYEKALRRLESAVDSTLGATGAIYAMRRSLWRPLPPDTILDDVLAPMRAVLDGARVVFTDRARAFDRAPAHVGDELRRKVRTLAGNYQILRLEPRLLLPWRNRVWLQYASHKIGRLIVPYAALAAFASSVALAGRGLVYAAALAVQVAFYLLAGCGAALETFESAAVADGAAPVRAAPEAAS